MGNEDLPKVPTGCGRCEESFNDYETCWFCLGQLCEECWDEFGHCGHERADQINERVCNGS